MTRNDSRILFATASLLLAGTSLAYTLLVSLRRTTTPHVAPTCSENVIAVLRNAYDGPFRFSRDGGKPSNKRKGSAMNVDDDDGDDSEEGEEESEDGNIYDDTDDLYSSDFATDAEYDSKEEEVEDGNRVAYYYDDEEDGNDDRFHRSYGHVRGGGGNGNDAIPYDVPPVAGGTMTIASGATRGSSIILHTLTAGEPLGGGGSYSCCYHLYHNGQQQQRRRHTQNSGKQQQQLVTGTEGIACSFCGSQGQHFCSGNSDRSTTRSTGLGKGGECCGSSAACSSKDCCVNLCEEDASSEDNSGCGGGGGGTCMISAAAVFAKDIRWSIEGMESECNYICEALQFCYQHQRHKHCSKHQRRHYHHCGWSGRAGYRGVLSSTARLWRAAWLVSGRGTLYLALRAQLRPFLAPATFLFSKSIQLIRQCYTTVMAGAVRRTRTLLRRTCRRVVFRGRKVVKRVLKVYRQRRQRRKSDRQQQGQPTNVEQVELMVAATDEIKSPLTISTESSSESSFVADSEEAGMEAMRLRDELLQKHSPTSVNRRLDEALRKLEPTPGRVPTVVVVRVPLGYGAMADAEDLWAALQQDCAASEDGLMDVIIIEELKATTAPLHSMLAAVPPTPSFLTNAIPPPLSTSSVPGGGAVDDGTDTKATTTTTAGAAAAATTDYSPNVNQCDKSIADNLNTKHRYSSSCTPPPERVSNTTAVPSSASPTTGSAVGIAGMDALPSFTVVPAISGASCNREDQAENDTTGATSAVARHPPSSLKLTFELYPAYQFYGYWYRSTVLQAKDAALRSAVATVYGGDAREIPESTAVMCGTRAPSAGDYCDVADCLSPLSPPYRPCATAPGSGLPSMVAATSSPTQVVYVPPSAFGAYSAQHSPQRHVGSALSPSSVSFAHIRSTAGLSGQLSMSQQQQQQQSSLSVVMEKTMTIHVHRHTTATGETIVTTAAASPIMAAQPQSQVHLTQLSSVLAGSAEVGTMLTNSSLCVSPMLVNLSRHQWNREERGDDKEGDSDAEARRKFSTTENDEDNDGRDSGAGRNANRDGNLRRHKEGSHQIDEATDSDRHAGTQIASQNSAGTLPPAPASLPLLYEPDLQVRYRVCVVRQGTRTREAVQDMEQIVQETRALCEEAALKRLLADAPVQREQHQQQPSASSPSSRGLLHYPIMSFPLANENTQNMGSVSAAATGSLYAATTGTSALSLGGIGQGSVVGPSMSAAAAAAAVVTGTSAGSNSARMSCHKSSNSLDVGTAAAAPTAGSLLSTSSQRRFSTLSTPSELDFTTAAPSALVCVGRDAHEGGIVGIPSATAAPVPLLGKRLSVTTQLNNSTGSRSVPRTTSLLTMTAAATAAVGAGTGAVEGGGGHSYHANHGYVINTNMGSNVTFSNNTTPLMAGHLRMPEWVLATLIRRESMRETLMKEMKETAFRVCSIPLPDMRVYRQVPVAVPRFAAAHARGYEVSHSCAEEIIHQQRALQQLLIEEEARRIRKERLARLRRLRRMRTKQGRRFVTRLRDALLPRIGLGADNSGKRATHDSDNSTTTSTTCSETISTNDEGENGACDRFATSSSDCAVHRATSAVVDQIGSGQLLNAGRAHPAIHPSTAAALAVASFSTPSEAPISSALCPGSVATTPLAVEPATFSPSILQNPESPTGRGDTSSHGTSGSLFYSSTRVAVEALAPPSLLRYSSTGHLNSAPVAGGDVTGGRLVSPHPIGSLEGSGGHRGGAAPGSNTSTSVSSSRALSSAASPIAGISSPTGFSSAKKWTETNTSRNYNVNVNAGNGGVAASSSSAASVAGGSTAMMPLTHAAASTSTTVAAFSPVHPGSAAAGAVGSAVAHPPHQKSSDGAPTVASSSQFTSTTASTTVATTTGTHGNGFATVGSSGSIPGGMSSLTSFLPAPSSSMYGTFDAYFGHSLLVPRAPYTPQQPHLQSQQPSSLCAQNQQQLRTSGSPHKSTSAERKSKASKEPKKKKKKRKRDKDARTGRRGGAEMGYSSSAEPADVHRMQEVFTIDNMKFREDWNCEQRARQGKHHHRDSRHFTTGKDKKLSEKDGAAALASGRRSCGGKHRLESISAAAAMPSTHHARCSTSPNVGWTPNTAGRGSALRHAAQSFSAIQSTRMNSFVYKSQQQQQQSSHAAGNHLARIAGSSVASGLLIPYTYSSDSVNYMYGMNPYPPHRNLLGTEYVDTDDEDAPPGALAAAMARTGRERGRRSASKAGVARSCGEHSQDSYAQIHSNLLELLGAGGGLMRSGVTYYYTYGDATACLFNASMRPTVESDQWESDYALCALNEEGGEEDAAGAMGDDEENDTRHMPLGRYAAAGGGGGRLSGTPPGNSWPTMGPSAGAGGGSGAPGGAGAAAAENASSYLFYGRDEMSEEEKAERQRIAARQSRNRAYYSIFRHLHDVFFNTITRVPLRRRRHDCAGGGGAAVNSDSDDGKSQTRCCAPVGTGRDSRSTGAAAAAHGPPPPLSPMHLSSYLPNIPQNGSDEVTFGEQSRLRQALDIQNGNFGLSPLEVWLATRYSRRFAAEVYVMDVTAVKGDPFYPAVRVIDEVVAHAVLYYHNRSLRDFLGDLAAEFDLHYTPRTRWGRYYLGLPLDGEDQALQAAATATAASAGGARASSSGAHCTEACYTDTESPHSNPCSFSADTRARNERIRLAEVDVTPVSGMALPRTERTYMFDQGCSVDHRRLSLFSESSAEAPLLELAPNHSSAEFQDCHGGDLPLVPPLATSTMTKRCSHDQHVSKRMSIEVATAAAAAASEEDVKRSDEVEEESAHETPDFPLYADQQEDESIFYGGVTQVPDTALGREAQEERMLMRELDYLKEFLIENRNVLSSATLTASGSNKLEAVFGAPATVFPFLMCGRESVALMHNMFYTLQGHYGAQVYERFAEFTRDVFERDRPRVIRQTPRIFRSINKSRRGYISYEELCSWMARKLSCGKSLGPDAHVIATSMSLRLPMALIIDKKYLWPELECTLASLSDCEEE